MYEDVPTTKKSRKLTWGPPCEFYIKNTNHPFRACVCFISFLYFHFFVREDGPIVKPPTSCWIQKVQKSMMVKSNRPIILTEKQITVKCILILTISRQDKNAGSCQKDEKY